MIDNVITLMVQVMVVVIVLVQVGIGIDIDIWKCIGIGVVGSSRCLCVFKLVQSSNKINFLESIGFTKEAYCKEAIRINFSRSLSKQTIGFNVPQVSRFYNMRI